jgi:hypothetical protein
MPTLTITRAGEVWHWEDDRGNGGLVGPEPGGGLTAVLALRRWHGVEPPDRITYRYSAGSAPSFEPEPPPRPLPAVQWLGAPMPGWKASRST